MMAIDVKSPTLEWLKVVLVRAGPKDLLHTQNVIIYVISILVFVIRVLLGKRKEY